MMFPWTEFEGKYVAEISSIAENLCPKCNEPWSLVHGAVRSREGEITHWEFVHECGATLTIFND